MTSTSASDLLPDELAALMHFYAESGVAWLSEDAAVDRFAEFAQVAASRSQPRVAPAESAGGQTTPRNETRPSRGVAAPMPPPAVAVPDAEAVGAATALAAEAASVEALMAAVEGFAGCNLRFSARHTVFARGPETARVVVMGGAPVAEDDREGLPFSGPSGRILDRMLAGVGMDAADLMLANMIPWRAPGDRAPTVREVEICAPFARRLIELVRPQAVLVLGNLSARVLSGKPKAGIHGLRGKWFDLAAGPAMLPAFPTFHPAEMMDTPTCKRLAWQDMLRFGVELASHPPQA